MSWFVVDVESDGPYLGVNSMVCFGAIKIDDNLTTTFYGKVKPVSEIFNPEALSVSGFTREQHLTFNEIEPVMKSFQTWIAQNNKDGRPCMFSDNIAYDHSWINYYFNRVGIESPFGWSGRRIGDIISGLEHDLYIPWKKYRRTPHTHCPTDDAKGNAEALIYFLDKHNIRIPK
jgi:DNA polymerase III alpha subunit (gram-positive type)